MNQEAADLAKEIKDAQIAEFGPDPGMATFPKAFFVWGVSVYKGDPKGPTVQPVSPSYCANTYGASRVSGLLGGAKSTPFLCPLNPAGLMDGWKTTADVPYCVFERNGKAGRPVNAAFLLDYFTHGYPGDLALSMAQQEVDGSFE